MCHLYFFCHLVSEDSCARTEAIFVPRAGGKSHIKGNSVDSRYLDFGYLEQPLISKKKSGPCLKIEI